MTATVRDLIKALQKFPMDTPVFTYSEYDECDGVVEVVELYTPTDEDKQMYTERGGHIQEPRYCKGESNVSTHWEKNDLCPVVYIRELGWDERNNERKEDVVCLTVDT